MFNQNLISLRKSKGWSQEQLGEAVNVSRQTVSKWELGSTTPEMNKLIELSEIFEVSIDELVGKSESTLPISKTKREFHYEYKSKAHLGALPLVHINIGSGMYKAKGFFSIGNLSAGVFSLGLISAGFLSLGVLSLGVIALGVIAAGVLAAACISLGIVAAGAVAVGYFAVGGLAVGVYAVGGCAIASNIALGGFASGKIAVGNIAKGTHVFLTDENLRLVDTTTHQLKSTISSVLPDTPKIIADIICLAIK